MGQLDTRDHRYGLDVIQLGCHVHDARNDKIKKGGIGMDDLSHAGDAMGYGVYRFAAIRKWKTGRSKITVY